MDLDERMREIEHGADDLEQDGYHESARLVRGGGQGSQGLL